MRPVAESRERSITESSGSASPRTSPSAPTEPSTWMNVPPDAAGFPPGGRRTRGVHGCVFFGPGLAQPMGCHDEGPFLDGRGLRGDTDDASARRGFWITRSKRVQPCRRTRGTVVALDPLNLGRGKPEAGPDVVGQDLHLGPAVTAFGLPAVLLQATGDHDPRPLGEAEGHVLGQLPPAGDVERRRWPPPTPECPGSASGG